MFCRHAHAPRQGPDLAAPAEPRRNLDRRAQRRGRGPRNQLGGGRRRAAHGFCASLCLRARHRRHPDSPQLGTAAAWHHMGGILPDAREVARADRAPGVLDRRTRHLRQSQRARRGRDRGQASRGNSGRVDRRLRRSAEGRVRRGREGRRAGIERRSSHRRNARPSIDGAPAPCGCCYRNEDSKAPSSRGTAACSRCRTRRSR